MNRKIISWVCAIVVAVIYVQTLYFKFSGAAESVYIFTKLFGENEKLMRIGSGIGELLASIILLFPKTRSIGAAISIGLISGAWFSHIFKLGIVVNNDGGLLFFLATIILLLSFLLLILHLKELPLAGKLFK